MSCPIKMQNRKRVLNRKRGIVARIVLGVSNEDWSELIRASSPANSMDSIFTNSLIPSVNDELSAIGLN